MRRVAVALVVLGAAVAAVVLGGPRAERAASVQAPPAPIPCSATAVPTERDLARAGRAEVGPAIVLGTRRLLRARPGRRTLRVLLAPGVPVRLRISGAAAADRRFAACPPVPAFDRAGPLLGHRMATIEIDLPRRGCLHLSAAVEGGVVASRWLGAGRRCRGTRSVGGVLAACHGRVEPAAPRPPAGALRLGALTAVPPAARDTTGARPPIAVKLPFLVEAGAVVTLRVAAPAAVRVGGSRWPARAVTFAGCPADEPLFSHLQGVVGPRTAFAGELLLPAAGCVRFEARQHGRAPVRGRTAVGRARCG